MSHHVSSLFHLFRPKAALGSAHHIGARARFRRLAKGHRKIEAVLTRGKMRIWTEGSSAKRVNPRKHAKTGNGTTRPHCSWFSRSGHELPLSSLAPSLAAAKAAGAEASFSALTDAVAARARAGARARELDVRGRQHVGGASRPKGFARAIFGCWCIVPLPRGPQQHQEKGDSCLTSAVRVRQKDFTRLDFTHADRIYTRITMTHLVI